MLDDEGNWLKQTSYTWIKRKTSLDDVLVDEINNIQNLSYKDLINNQQKAWAKKWSESDIVIEGDIAVGEFKIPFNKIVSAFGHLELLYTRKFIGLATFFNLIIFTSFF